MIFFDRPNKTLTITQESDIDKALQTIKETKAQNLFITDMKLTLDSVSSAVTCIKLQSGIYTLRNIDIARLQCIETVNALTIENSKIISMWWSPNTNIRVNGSNIDRLVICDMGGVQCLLALKHLAMCTENIRSASYLNTELRATLDSAIANVHLPLFRFKLHLVETGLKQHSHLEVPYLDLFF